MADVVPKTLALEGRHADCENADGNAKRVGQIDPAVLATSTACLLPAVSETHNRH
jgi:hypothetical protein